MTVSTHSRSSSSPRSACIWRFLPFELERLGDDRDRQRAELAGQAGDHRRGAGAGAAAEPGRDEHHVGAVERFDQLLGVLERRLAADVRDRRRRRAPWSASRRSAACSARRSCRSACRSVLATMNSTPSSPAATMRLTALLPPPPTPTTLMRAPDAAALVELQPQRRRVGAGCCRVSSFSHVCLRRDCVPSQSGLESIRDRYPCDPCSVLSVA